jgi:hypothetical protein
VALTGISSFDSNEERAFTVLKRLYIRKNHLNKSYYIIIQTAFRMYRMRKRQGVKECYNSTAYMILARKLKQIRLNKLSIKRDLNKDRFATDEDLFVDLEGRVDENLHFVKESLSHLEQYKIRLKLQINHQKTLIHNVENALKIQRF